MPTIEFLFAYFTSPLPLSVIASTALLMLLSYVAFRWTDSASTTRSTALTLLLLLSPFLWTFLGSSLLLCSVFAEVYEYNLSQGVKSVLGGALSVSVGLSVPLSLFIQRRAPAMVIKRLKTSQDLSSETLLRFAALARRIGIGEADLLKADLSAPVSLAVSAKRKVVVVSQGLMELLDADETETVLGHELAHLKNGDSTVKAFAFVLTRLLPFDLLLRLVEAATHRERELLADEVSALATKKPIHLASALLKIHERLQGTPTDSILSLGIAGLRKGLFSRHPPLSLRISRLLEIAERLPTLETAL